MAHNGAFIKKGVLFIFLLALLCTAGVFLWQRHMSREHVFVAYTVMLDLETYEADTLSLGDALIDACGKEPAGTVAGIKREPMLYEDGFGLYEREGHERVVLTLFAAGTRGEEGVCVGTLDLCAGKEIYLHGRAKYEGICIRVRVL